MQNIGERFKEIREYLRLSQEQIGKQIGLSKAGISGVEKNKSFMSKEVLSKLVIGLNVNLNWLISGEGEMFLTSKGEKSLLSRLEEEGVEPDSEGILRKKI